MWNVLSSEQLASIPALYASEGVPLRDKIVWLHFFVSGCDWFAMEFDGKDTFFGFAILNQDYEMAEFGYFSFTELKSIKLNRWLEVDCDLYWEPRPAREVELICRAQGWHYEPASSQR